MIIDPDSCSPAKKSDTCQPLPETVRRQFGFSQDSNWVVSEYTVALNGDVWAWERQLPQLEPGETDIQTIGTDLLVFVEPEIGGEPTTRLKFEAVGVKTGETVHLPDVFVYLTPREAAVQWVVYPED